MCRTPWAGDKWTHGVRAHRARKQCVSEAGSRRTLRHATKKTPHVHSCQHMHRPCWRLGLPRADSIATPRRTDFLTHCSSSVCTILHKRNAHAQQPVARWSTSEGFCTKGVAEGAGAQPCPLPLKESLPHHMLRNSYTTNTLCDHMVMHVTVFSPSQHVEGKVHKKHAGRPGLWSCHVHGPWAEVRVFLHSDTIAGRQTNSC